MTYRVFYTEGFRSNIAKHVTYLREQSASDDVIERWYDRLFIELDSLALWPSRHSVDERMSTKLGQECRKFVFGQYVITYIIDEGQRRVDLIRIVHGARRR